MISKEVLGFVSVLFSVIGIGIYLWGVWKKGVRPHIFSWVVWGLLSSIAFFAQLAERAGPGAWATGFVAFGYLTIAVLALKRGERKITRGDWASFLAALMAIPLWFLTGDPLGSVVWVTAIEALGYYPTFRKSFINPHSESAPIYVLAALKDMTALAAVENYVLTNIVYLLFSAVMNLSFVAMIAWRRRLFKAIPSASSAAIH